MRRLLSGLLLSAVALVGCGSGQPTAAGDGSTNPSPGTIAEGAVRTRVDGQPVVTEARPEADTAWRTFTVDGAEVQTLTTLDDLPATATTVRFTGTLIDSGDGLELCITGVADSLPPQCSGPVVDGLDPAGWTETANGVTWGDRTVTVAWPPTAGDHLTLLSDESAVRVPPSDADDIEAMSQLPPECEGIRQLASRDAVTAYAGAHPEVIGAAWSIRQGEFLVIGVVEASVDTVRADLSTDGAQPCIVPMRYSMAELQAVQQHLSETGLSAVGGPVLWSGQIGRSNVMSVGVAVADRSTVAKITSQLDDPGMTRVVGSGEILDGDR